MSLALGGSLVFSGLLVEWQGVPSGVWPEGRLRVGKLGSHLGDGGAGLQAAPSASATA